MVALQFRLCGVEVVNRIHVLVAVELEESSMELWFGFVTVFMTAPVNLPYSAL